MNNVGMKQNTAAQSGFEQFQAQRQKLRANLDDKRLSDISRRFDALDETQKKVIIMLANDAAFWLGIPALTRSCLYTAFERLTSKEQSTLLLGIKKLSELSAVIPWCWPDDVSLSSERLAERQARQNDQGQQSPAGSEPAIS